MKQDKIILGAVLAIYFAYCGYDMVYQMEHCHAAQCEPGYELSTCAREYHFQDPLTVGHNHMVCAPDANLAQNCFTSEGETQAFYRYQVLQGNKSLWCVNEKQKRHKRPAFVHDSATFLWGEKAIYGFPIMLAFIMFFVYFW